MRAKILPSLRAASVACGPHPRPLSQPHTRTAGRGEILDAGTASHNVSASASAEREGEGWRKVSDSSLLPSPGGPGVRLGEGPGVRAEGRGRLKIEFRRLILPLLLLVCAPAFAQDAPPADPGAAITANKELVKRYISEVLTANRLDRLDEMLAPDFTDNTPGLVTGEAGPAVIRKAQERIRSVFPTVEYVIEDLIGEGDKVVARYTVNAATKEAEGAPAQKVHITGMTIFRVSGGRIRETWIINDQVELYRQLGFTLQPPDEKPAGPPGSK
jgi:predicted ester cyclase